MTPNLARIKLPGMQQLVQIGESPRKTILQFVQEMATRQLSEIEQLKRSVLERENRRRRSSRVRCEARVVSQQPHSS